MENCPYCGTKVIPVENWNEKKTELMLQGKRFPLGGPPSFATECWMCPKKGCPHIVFKGGNLQVRRHVFFE